MALSKIVLAIDLGGNRHLHVHKDNEVFIKDLVSTKCAFFMASRWKRFVGMIANIDRHVQLASVGKTTKYRLSLLSVIHQVFHIKNELFQFIFLLLIM